MLNRSHATCRRSITCRHWYRSRKRLRARIGRVAGIAARRPVNLQAQLLYGIVSYGRNQFTIADDYLTRVFAEHARNLQVAKVLVRRASVAAAGPAIAVLSSAVDDETRTPSCWPLLVPAYIQVGDTTGFGIHPARGRDRPRSGNVAHPAGGGQDATGDTGGHHAARPAVALRPGCGPGRRASWSELPGTSANMTRRWLHPRRSSSVMADSPIPYNLTGLAFLAQRRFDDARHASSVH